MRSRSPRIPLVAGICLAAAAPVLAGGFSIYEAGAKATGMGCAVTASVDDASALFYNVGALGFMSGTVVDVSLIPIMPRSEFRRATPPEPAATGRTIDRTFPVPAFGITHNPGGRLSYGLGLCAPFGLGVEWQDPENWPGRYTSYDVGLATVYVIPAVGYRVDERLSVGVGLDIAW